MSLGRRLLYWSLVAGFGFGAATHGFDVIRFGWPSYRVSPGWLALFWNALVLFDAAVVGLLVARWWRSGLGLALAVMVMDVIANGYAALRLGMSGFAVALPLQAGFLLIVLAGVIRLWPSSASGAR